MKVNLINNTTLALFAFVYAMRIFHDRVNGKNKHLFRMGTCHKTTASIGTTILKRRRVYPFPRHYSSLLLPLPITPTFITSDDYYVHLFPWLSLLPSITSSSRLTIIFNYCAVLSSFSIYAICRNCISFLH